MVGTYVFETRGSKRELGDGVVGGGGLIKGENIRPRLKKGIS